MELFPLRAATASIISDCLLNNVIFRYGVPHNLVSDNGPQFISSIFKDFCDRLSIKHILTTPYHPQSNLTERVNRNIGRMIASYVAECHEKWDENLGAFGYALRSSFHETTRLTPAELFLGRKILTPFERLASVLEATTQQPSLEKLIHLAQRTQQNIVKAQEKQKKYYDRHRRESDLSEGDYVLLHSHFLSSSANVVVQKFLPLYEGPYMIIKKTTE